MGETGRICNIAAGAWTKPQRIWDDISGKELDWELVAAARAEEMEEFRKHEVYVKVPIAKCWGKTGKKPIGVRWVDINEGDQVSPEYRSILVAKELKITKIKGTTCLRQHHR